MKRRREETEKGFTEIRLAMEELSSSLTPHEETKASTLALLSLSKQLLHFLDKIGPTLLVLRQDIQQNVERVEEAYAKDPSKYSNLTEILMIEVGEGTTRKPNSCTKAILWLTRSTNFAVSLLERLVKCSELSLREVVEEAYRSTLEPWHGWISSAAYRVALKLIPEREIFVDLLMGKSLCFEELTGDIKSLLSMLQPFLDEINAILKKHRFDKLKST
ncbi:glycolipid transfer protein 3-like isoform X1 [Ananas comosus]|uniref:Glycolipid transfer protein 3-like isoform X1 n=1 Tax=Ananas comosus TaxID=4615 RepID=A0A6P5EW53_ANACO|nr:glycolipid transfer protein 3-like isoform X1 [Ananas comosus]